MKKVVDLSFRELMEELESLTSQLDSESMDIDKALESYERGKLVVEELEKRIDSAEQKIEKIQKGSLSGSE